VVQNQYLTLWNHDQIARTEDFAVGLTASVRLGYAATALGSTADAVMIQSSAAKGFSSGGSGTLLLYSDFSGRLEGGTLRNGLADISARYYKEQSKNWLFFTTFAATKGWSLDLDNQILLGGDNGLRGYPLRYQAGDARALLTIEQRYFTDWYPFRLLRVGGAVFYDMGRTWGSAPLAQPSLGLLKDVGFGLRLGNARSGLGNVIHIDLAFPLDGDSSIEKVQFLVQTEVRF
jgi:hemolysin activation/secretion protein